MLFNSYIFIFAFLPTVVIGYFILNHFKKYKLSKFFLFMMSLLFYGYFNISYLAIILLSILVNYGIYLLLRKHKKNKTRKTFLILGLISNIGCLGYFKYMNFFIENINFILKKHWTIFNITMPLGISFFTFQQLSFIIDSYKKEVPKYDFLDYACYVTFFPQLIAGPIVMHDELIPQFTNIKKKKINWDNIAKGIYIFVLGLCKKVLIADTFGNIVNIGFENINILNSTNAIITILAYTIQIYFDFSGYCDMAIGAGKMLNIDLPINFNSPYKALTITDFWDRWHITLTRFLKKYVYIPLGGNKKGNVRTYANILLVFLISGIWHGANWTFIVWGLCHGIFFIITRHFKKFFKELHPALNWLITFSFINITFIIFRADSLRQALKLLYTSAKFNIGSISKDVTNAVIFPEIKIILKQIPLDTRNTFFVLVIFLIMFLILKSKNAFEKMKSFEPSVLKLLTTSILFIWAVLSLSGVNKFLYFNF